MSQQGAQILDQTRDHLTRFVHFPSPAAATVATLWCAHTWARDPLSEKVALDSSPRIWFGSDDPGSGKTVALEGIARMSCRPHQVLDPTPATYAIMADQQHASIFLDEADECFGHGAKGALRSLLNSGYKPNGRWQRANGDSLSVFAPVAFAGLSSRFRTSAALSALRSRTIMVEMAKRPQNSETEAYKDRLHGPTARYTANCLGTWVRKHLPLILSIFPEFPEVSDRKAELAEPLLQIADAAGGHWSADARTALAQLLNGTLLSEDETDTPEDEMPLPQRLLLDLAAVWPQDTAKMKSQDLTDALRALPASPWVALWPSPTAAPRELKALLQPYGIEPTMLYVSPELSFRGYRFIDLEPYFPQAPEPLHAVA